MQQSARASLVSRGQSAPLGAAVMNGGVNFSVYSRDATLVELLLYNHESDRQPSQVIALDPHRHRTYHYWHAFVADLKPGQIYAYRAHGSYAPELGLHFDGERVLLDPYGLSVAIPAQYDRKAATQPGDNGAHALKSVVINCDTYDWEGDRPLCRSSNETVIYELHVRGFTIHPSSGVSPEKRGTYAGLIEKIPYLKDLGVTAVELLPVFQFDEQDAPQGRTNYWGYQPISFFSPHRAYSSRKDPQGVIDEFRDMVKALHRAGIEVILDVVFNHTTEGGKDGPTLCYRGLANDTYYILEEDKARYADFTGCGNTLNANQPIVRRMIQDSLRYWVAEMHVDGFRFDLASILARDTDGRPLPNPPVLWDIESDPLTSGTKLIAEAWDAGGLYQVGSFVGDAWQEWNGHFRDDVRRFLRGDEGKVSALATRLLGSPDLFARDDREAEQSINFITCHDGFTLNDLVSYNDKHNWDNGEDNRDGMNDNFSWNCGHEGETNDPYIQELRNRQVKNHLTVLMLSAGLPMLLAGDEVRRTQRGNNNAYCQDNELSWFDWTLFDQHADVHRFVQHLCRYRTSTAQGTTTLTQLIQRARVRWHGVKLNAPDWATHSHSLAAEILSQRGPVCLYAIFNAYREDLSFELPPIPSAESQPWRRCIDTGNPSPYDILPMTEAPAVSDSVYLAKARSIVLLARFLSCRVEES
jgi:isoamylase